MGFWENFTSNVFGRAFENNDIAEVNKVIEECFLSPEIEENFLFSADILTKAIDLNNDGKLDATIIDAMIVSGKFDITPNHCENVVDLSIKKSLSALKLTKR